MGPVQIFVDTFIVSQWVKSDKEWQEEQDRLAADALQLQAEPEILKM